MNVQRGGLAAPHFPVRPMTQKSWNPERPHSSVHLPIMTLVVSYVESYRHRHLERFRDTLAHICQGKCCTNRMVSHFCRWVLFSAADMVELPAKTGTFTLPSRRAKAPSSCLHVVEHWGRHRNFHCHQCPRQSRHGGSFYGGNRSGRGAAFHSDCIESARTNLLASYGNPCGDKRHWFRYPFTPLCSALRWRNVRVDILGSCLRIHFCGEGARHSRMNISVGFLGDFDDPTNDYFVVKCRRPAHPASNSPANSLSA